MNESPEFRPARSRVAAVVAGSVVFALVDAAIGARLDVGRVSGGARTALFFQIILSHAAVFGVGLGLVLGALHLALGRIRVPLKLFRPTMTTVVIAVATTAVVQFLNWRLFEGPAISAKSWKPMAETAFRILVIPGVPIAVFLAAAMTEARRPWRAVWGFALLAAGGACLWANANLFRQQYPDLHTQLAIFGLGFLAAGVHAVLSDTMLDFGRTRARTFVLVGAMLAVLGASYVAKTHDRYPSVRGVALDRAFGVGKLAFVSGPVVNALTVTAPSAAAKTVDVGDLLKALSTGDDTEIQKTLDGLYPDRKKLNVLMIAVDTLRADHCGFLNPALAAQYGRSPTPNLDALAAESFVFENAYTPYPTSNYAYNGMFMSLAPRITKVYTDKYQPAIKHDPLHALPELAARNGWKTSAVASFNKVDLANPRLFKYLKDGFQVFNPDPWESMASGAQIAASASNLAVRIGAEDRTPFFFWAHFLDPHAPYQDNPGYKFGDTTKDWYVSDIAYCDHYVGQFVEHLKKLNLWKDTIVVAFSDHGEEFGERGGRDHNGSVYEEQIKVPLIVRLPGVAPQGKRIKSTVSLLDLQPTLTRLLKLDDPLPRLGQSLLPLIFGPENPEGGVAYAEWFQMTGNFRSTERRALIMGRRKIIHRVNEKAYELYDLGADPGEKNSLIGEARDEEVLKTLLAKWDERIDGYFGGKAASRKSATEPFQAILKKVRDKNAEAKALAKTDAAAGRDATAAARAAVVEYRNALMTGYGDVYTHVALTLTPEELDGLFTSLAELYPELEEGPAAEALVTLARRRDRRFESIYRKEIEPLRTGEIAKLRGGAMEALIALTTLGDESVKLPLQVAYSDPAMPFKGAIAVGLARLGDFTGADWLVLNLSALRFGSVYRDSILAAPKIAALLTPNSGLPPSRMLRDRLTEEDYRHNEIELAYVEALGHLKDEDATILLLRMARHTVSDVRDAAQIALKERFTDPAELARRLDAADEELTADNMLLNMTPEAATPTYRRALEKGGVFNAALRFRMARAFHLGKNTDQARATLEEIAARAPLAVDRELAKRRIAQLAFPILQRPEAFGCEVKSITPPSIIRSTQFFAVRARLKNTGTEPWWGGYAKGSVDIGVRFVQPDGTVYETVDEKNLTNRITEAGVLPGEEIDVHLLGYGPRQKFAGKLAIVFRNDRLNYPNKGLVYVADQATDLDGRPANRPETRTTSRPASRPGKPAAVPPK